MRPGPARSPRVAHRFGCALLLAAALLAAWTAAPALAFDPSRDRPSTAYGDAAAAPGLYSPNNVVERSRIDPRRVTRGQSVTFAACYTFARPRQGPFVPGAAVGRLWQQWANELTGDWFYLYAVNEAPSAAGPPLFSLYHYNQPRGATRLATGLAPNVVYAPAATALDRAPGEASAVFELVQASVGLPDWSGREGSPAAHCQPDPGDDALYPVSFAVTLRWPTDTTGWRATTVTLSQAVESRPEALAGRGAVFFDGWRTALNRIGQLALVEPEPAATVAPPPSAAPAGASPVPVRGRLPAPRRLVPLVLVVVAIALYALRRPLRRRTVETGWMFRALAGEGWRGLAAARRDEEPTHLAALIGLCLLALLLRLLYLAQPMRYDEAVTFLTFASRPLLVAASNYAAPNNHVLHTVLVHLSSGLFGNQPWAIRLPAFAAGVLVVPAAYLAFRGLHGKSVGLLTAASVASSSILVEYSTNARGYTLVTLLFLLMLALAPRLSRRDDRAAWRLLALLAALGLFTVPTMAYGFAIVVVWLLLTIARSQAVPDRLVMLTRLVGTTALAAGLALVLYAPAMLASGPASFFDNAAVQARSWSDLVAYTWPFLQSIWAQWVRDVPLPLQAVVVGGLLAPVLTLRAPAPAVPRLAWVALVVMALMYAAPRAIAPARTWLFLLPLVLGLGWCSVAELVRAAPWRPPWCTVRPVAALAVLVALGLGLNVVASGSIYRSSEGGTLADASAIALFFKESLEPGDRVLAATPSDAPLTYYFLLHDVPTRYLYADPGAAERALLVVNESGEWRQSPGDVLRYWGLPAALADQLRPLRRFASATVYEVRLRG